MLMTAYDLIDFAFRPSSIPNIGDILVTLAPYYFIVGLLIMAAWIFFDHSAKQIWLLTIIRWIECSFNNRRYYKVTKSTGGNTILQSV
jgi:hypothetical protein